MTSWLLDLPANEVVSLNHREHWAKRNRKVQAWKDDTITLARAARIPRCERISVTLEHWPRDNRRRDRDNLVPVLKAAIDGLVAAGVVEDDTPDRVTAMLPVIHKPRDDRQPMWLLTVSECAA